MKTLKFLLATLAVSCAFSATAFAAELSNDYNYTFDVQVTPETVKAGETVEVAVFLSATDAEGNAIDELTWGVNTSTATLSLGLDYDADVLTWIDNDTDGMYTDTKYDAVDLFYSVQDNGGNLGLVLSEQYRKIGAIAPDTTLITYKFKVADDADTATYNASNPLVALKSDTTSYAILEAETVKKTLNVPTVSVVGAGPVEDKSVKTDDTLTDGKGVVELTYGKDAENKTLEGKKVYFGNAKVDDAATLTNTSRLVVTYNNAETKTYNIFAAVNAEGDGAMDGDSVAFGIIFTGDLNTDLFTFEIK